MYLSGRNWLLPLFSCSKLFHSYRRKLSFKCLIQSIFTWRVFAAALNWKLSDKPVSISIKDTVSMYPQQGYQGISIYPFIYSNRNLNWPKHLICAKVFETLLCSSFLFFLFPLVFFLQLIPAFWVGRIWEVSGLILVTKLSIEIVSRLPSFSNNEQEF